VKALAKQLSGMRRRAVIVRRKRPPRFVDRIDMPEIAPLGGIKCERLPLQRGLAGRGADRVLAAAPIGKAVRANPGAGEIIGRGFPDRQPVDKSGGQRIRGVVVLVAALEGGHPQLAGGGELQRVLNIAAGGIEIMAQAARRCAAKTGRLQPEQGRRREGLLPPPRYPGAMAAPLPSTRSSSRAVVMRAYSGVLV
jgi:hypothetical protein